MSRRRRKPDPAELEPTWEEGLADRMNPVMARDLIQTTNARAWSALTLLVWIGLFVMQSMGAPFDELLGATIATMWFLVPFRVFSSTRGEIVGRTRETLLLSGVDSQTFAVGKLAAAGVLAAVPAGIVAPLLAATWSSHGSAVATLLLAAWVIASGSFTLCALATGLAAAIPNVRPKAAPIACAGAVLGAIGWSAWRHSEALLQSLELAARVSVWPPILGCGLMAALAGTLSLLLVDAAFAPQNETRSARFRILATVSAAVSSAAMLAFDLDGATTLWVFVFLLPFWLGAATEAAPSDARPLDLGTRGPASGWLWSVATLAVPWCVGRSLVHDGDIARDAIDVGFAYSVAGASVAAILRTLQPGERVATLQARWFVAIAGAAALPVIANAASGEASTTWTWIHSLNPITTFAAIADGRVGDHAVLGTAILAVVLGASAMLPLITALRPAQAEVAP